MKRFLIIITSLLIVTPIQAQPEFTWHTISTDVSYPISQDAADLDGDGDLDVICTGWGTPISWWKNLGGYPPEFEVQTLLDSMEYGLYVKIADLDDDEDMDIVATGSHDGLIGNCVKWWENDGENPVSFTSHDLLPDQRISEPIGIGDLDDDGDLEIVLAGLWTEYNPYLRKIIIFENSGDGQFDSLTVEHIILYVNDLSLFDIDGDFDFDIVFSNPSTGFWWMENLGDVSFSDRIQIGTNQNGQSFDVLDLDNDEDFDLVFTNGPAHDNLNWFENDGEDNPGFTEHFISFYSEPVAVKAADFDLDEDMDFIVASGDIEGIWGEITLWLNDGEQNFEENFVAGGFYGPYGPNCMTIVDFDFDGDPDIVASAGDYPAIIWLENHLIDAEIEAFRLELPEPGFATPDTQVVLVWNQAIPNFETEITYHIKCLDDPDNDEIIAETSDTTFVFTGVPGTQYFWDIKAVAHNGLEQWAEEQFWHFTIVDTTNSVDDPSISSFPTEYAIQSVYPNPFNASTTITVTLPQPSYLTMRVFNTTGQLVSSLARGQYSQGYHDIVLNGSGLSSGIYFIRLEVAREQRFPGNSGLIQKILLIK